MRNWRLRLGIELGRPTTLITYHPTTIARDTIREADALFSAIQAMPGQLLFCYPNADAGSRALIERMELCLRGRADGKIFVNLEPVVYWSLLQYVDLLVGNSSSGIIEAASFALPVVMSGFGSGAASAAATCSTAEPTVTSILERIRIARSRGIPALAQRHGRTRMAMAGRRGE